LPGSFEDAEAIEDGAVGQLGPGKPTSFACLLGGPRLVAGDGVAVGGEGGAAGDDNVWTRDPRTGEGSRPCRDRTWTLK
jgi:hypothetical protein